MTKGYVSMVLHSHLPFTRHPEDEDALEERWLFEAMNECYLPLIQIYDNLLNEKIDFRMTTSITPPLMAMLQDEYLMEKYMIYMNNSIELIQKELVRTKHDKKLNKLVEFYNDRFNDLYKVYKNYDGNLMNAFKKFDKLGKLEIITCSATHGLLPLLSINPETVRAQILTGVESYVDCIGHEPKGIWIPECAYTYSLDSVLKEAGLKYFISESKATLNASPKPKYGSFAPIATTNGISTFSRDMESSYQVWSNVDGYPGDANYREFYRDIGYELDMDYIAPYINQHGIRIDTGIKYHKITGKTDQKEYYDREMALNKTREHGTHFAESRHNQIKSISEYMNQPPIITCPYDTELFGHWWFEGPDFINQFIRKSAEESTCYELITPSEYLDKYPMVQCCSPSPSSWGEHSDYSVWLNPSNHWIYKDIHECAEAMIEIAKKYNEPDTLQERILNQMARELMLAESSDWPFIIKHNTTVRYAVRRVKDHVERFSKLYNFLISNVVDEMWLKEIEELDNIFPKVNYRVYR